MSLPPRKKPDRHYDFDRMNVWFAWTSVALLLVTGWMVWADYEKPWKRIQAEFRDLEREDLAAQAEVERQQLNANEIEQVQQDIEAESKRLEEQRQEIGELEERLVAAGDAVYAEDVASRKTKSLLDTANYIYDRAVQEGDPEQVEKARSDVENLKNEHLERRKTLEALLEQESQDKNALEQRRAGLEQARNRLAALNQGFDSLQERVDGLEKKIDYYLLNAPLMDIFKPPVSVQQVMLPGLYHNINFTNVDRVDRCVTCHVAANREGFDGEQWSVPFRTHPRMDLFVGAASPHPYSKFGCTSCHGGLDRAVDFSRVGHSPQNSEQGEEWAEKWGWERQPYLATPILPANVTEAGCVTCHAGEVWTPQSEVQDVGRELVNRMGCFACHKIDYPAFENLPRPGPSLRKVASKTTPGWAYQWISAPRDFRPTSWMPHFFFQENTVSTENAARQKAEIASAVAYLWDQSATSSYESAPPGDGESGRRLFETVGCTGCHLLDADATRDQYFPQTNRMHGPNLVRTGSKVSSGWLFAWLKDPKKYNPETLMPSLRLTDQEAADLVAYLMASRDPEFEGLSLPQIDLDVRDDLVRVYLQSKKTIEQSEAVLAAMSSHQRNVFLGKETIQKYGCWGCHEMAGFDNLKPIGVELTEEGSKPLHQLDFGHVHDVPHTRHDWIKTKLMRPRAWDKGKEEAKAYAELLKMPDFGMSEREANAVLTTVLGFTRESVVASRRAGTSQRKAALAAGRKLITTMNCQGCHLVEGSGHAIRSAMENEDLLPPNLAAEGARVQADWLFGYLHDPESVRMRPWLGARMPTFGFSDSEVNTLISYFGARETRQAFASVPERPSSRDLVAGEVAFGMFQCAKCHPAGPQDQTDGVVSAGELAPSLLLARNRLRHDWVASWILQPQSWITGTRMPSNFQQDKQGNYSSPLADAIDAPMFAGQKRRLLSLFESEQDLAEHLGDAEYVTRVLRDHIWWSMRNGSF